MSSGRFTISMLSMGLMLLAAGVSSGQNYPNKPIRILASDAGSEVDGLARRVAPAISVPLGQPVIVENRPGSISPEIVAKAIPDGYTLLMVAGSVWIGPLIQKAPYDPVKDLEPIAAVAARAAIRTRLASSQLVDMPAHTRNLEAAYLEALRLKAPEALEEANG